MCENPQEDLADIINIAIEELVRHKHEFPAFSALRRFAYEGRANVNEKLYRQITRKLTKKDKKNLDRLFVVEEDQQISPWQAVKSEPKNLTRQNLKERIEYNTWIDQYVTGLNALNLIPDVKIKKFSSEAKSMKAAEMEDLKLYKKYALAITLITVQKAVSLDDLGEMFIKQVTNLRQSRRLEKCEPLKAGKLLAASKAAYGYRTWLNKSNCSKRLSSFS
ncbi:hypothetical protein [Desulfobacter hydrogenophilus]|uniref:Uncharacterized protein n=1 Tax=Desulfobacter hydrogenophilus TaxID=2291 RepID=A0ABX5RIG3_9BACT|nr:hypothetical protein [Desulfobacter hydrogenophilus]NDY73023.1 hypothetical protein [Desulfobacter hydrogenophilus]QBH14723.1 hypothetical protein EYB58_18445 [Desulfobacter hydrogenophilus]